ncbi:MAG: hypothetical protein L3J69_04420 [Desulfobacula sp.]|nr:hypothetical protein [Desulfobacula sp.]
MTLKDFKPGDPDLDPNNKNMKTADTDIESSGYHEEINTLKIDKLSNRITIIAIMLPCLIGAILIFAYLDMKERVVDVDETKNTQVERISQQLEEKLNALDVKIAKNRYDLDNQVPVLSKKLVAIEGQIAKLSGSKADTKSLKSIRSALGKLIAQNTKQNKSNLQRTENLNKSILVAIKENKLNFEKTTTQIKNESKLFKEEFDARLLELSVYQQELGELRKNFSLLDKKFKRYEQESVSLPMVNEKMDRLNSDLSNQLSKIKIQVAALNKKLAANLTRLQKDLDLLIKSSMSQGPQPQINIDAADANSIDQAPLIQ